MGRSKLYEIIGLASGFLLIDYGFNLLAAGFAGLRPLTSQLVGVNLLVGGSVAVFFSLFYLLKPPTSVQQSTQPTRPMGRRPDIGIGLVVEEEPPSQYGFYRNIQYIRFFFTGLGLFSAVDLVLQVLVPGLYNETRWWVEVLLATFGVLSYAIFGSIGHIGAQEEKLYVPPVPSPTTTSSTEQREMAQGTPIASEQALQMRISEFSKASPGEYERQLSGTMFDMFRIEPGTTTVWRENRAGFRSVYLAGPYELSRELIEEYAKRGEELKIGYLSLSVETLQDLLRLQGQQVEGPKATVG